MPVCLLFLCFFQTKIHLQPLWHYSSIYGSLLPNVRHIPEECHTTSGRIFDEEESTGSTMPAILRLLIKTRQCYRLLDSNRMFSAHCQWRLQRQNCCTNYRSLQIMNDFPFCFQEGSCRSILQLDVFVVVSLLSAFFIPGALLAHVVAHHRPHTQPICSEGADRQWYFSYVTYISHIITNNITSITPPYIICFNFIPLANPHY